MFRNLVSRDPNRAPVPTTSVEASLDAAKVRNSLAAENLRSTLSELLDESDRLNFRPVYLAGPRDRN